VTFLYENRDAFRSLRKDMISLLQQCELVSLTPEEAPELKQYVFAILADDVAQVLSDDAVYDRPDKEVIRLLFKWMDENPELIKSWAEKAVTIDSHKYDPIKEFLLLSEGLDASAFIFKYPDIYKSLIKKEWLDKNDIYSMLKDKINTALENSKTLRERNKNADFSDYSMCNVDLLIEKIQELGKN
jgi:hypothetical protein